MEKTFEVEAKILNDFLGEKKLSWKTVISAIAISGIFAK